MRKDHILAINLWVTMSFPSWLSCPNPSLIHQGLHPNNVLSFCRTTGNCSRVLEQTPEKRPWKIDSSNTRWSWTCWHSNVSFTSAFFTHSSNSRSRRVVTSSGSRNVSHRGIKRKLTIIYQYFNLWIFWSGSIRVKLGPVHMEKSYLG